MTPFSSPALMHTRRPPARMRWIALCMASLLLHLLAIEWASGRLRLPALRSHNDTVIAATLLRPAPLPAPILPAAAPASRAKPRPHPHKAVRHAPPPPAAMPAPPAAPPAIEDLPLESAEAGMETPGTSAEPIVPLQPPPEEHAPVADRAARNGEGVHYKISPPPSVELHYDVKKVPQEGNPMYGHGTINWQTSGSGYTINGDAGVLFITALTFKSEGAFDDFGIAPLLYSEKRFRRSETNTHFQRERNTISFSASETSYPRKGGEQDRASIVWQLAGIGRGDPEKFAPGAEIDIFVAGVRDGEIWRIQVIGQEDIDVGIGKTSAWHVVRAPRPGSYDQKLDIWLAPQYEWYPVKLRYTETNGDYLDMSLSDLNRVAAR